MTDGTTLKERIDAALEAAGYHLVSARLADIPLRRPALGVVTMYDGMAESEVGRLVPVVLVYVERPLKRNDGRPDMERDVDGIIDILQGVPDCYVQTVDTEDDEDDEVSVAVVRCYGV